MLDLDRHAWLMGLLYWLFFTVSVLLTLWGLRSLRSNLRSYVAG